MHKLIGLRAQSQHILELDLLGGGEDDPRSTALLIRGFVHVEHLGRDFFLKSVGRLVGVMSLVGSSG